MRSVEKQTTGKFPAYSGVDKSKRFNPPKRAKPHSSVDQNTGDFPTKTSRGSEKRFNPPKP